MLEALEAMFSGSPSLKQLDQITCIAPSHREPTCITDYARRMVNHIGNISKGKYPIAPDGSADAGKAA